MKVKLLSRVQLFATPWTVTHQASLSMGFSKQEYWSGLLFPPPGDLPDPGIEPVSPALQADSLPLSHLGSPCPCWPLTCPDYSSIPVGPLSPPYMPLFQLMVLIFSIHLLNFNPLCQYYNCYEGISVFYSLTQSLRLNKCFPNICSLARH